jgi:hypothetical protein
MPFSTAAAGNFQLFRTFAAATAENFPGFFEKIS